MNEAELKKSNRAVARWVLAGVMMLMIQVLLGGITRLTGSGLSITEWKPILGALPPMNDADWNIAFDKYKEIAQYKQLNAHFTLADFKSIYFWEWLHRLWARLIAVAFIIPFAYFLFKKMIKREMINGLIILFLLGLLQGFVGWIMVASGLEDSPLLFVSHYKLAIHFVLAMGIICYALWFALQLMVPNEKIIADKSIYQYHVWMIVLLVLQLIYGAFMAGLKAAPYALTWPDINGKFFPDYSSHASNIALFDNPYLVHFIHRSLGYIIVIAVLFGWWKFKTDHPKSLFAKTKWLLPAITLLQLLLGIFTVLNAADTKKLIWLGTAHQFVAMLLLLSLIWNIYIIRSKPVVNRH